MEKYKLKPIEHRQIATKKRESRPTTPSMALNYPSDIRLRILPNMCKSTVFSQLSEAISSLTKLIKAQKPLTLKPHKYHSCISSGDRKAGKIVESVEQYLSGIDIALLDKPAPMVDSIEEIVSLLNAKDEKEAIGSLYQMLALLEVLVNRLVQAPLIALFNAGRISPALLDPHFNEKPANMYFDSPAAAVHDVMQLFQEMCVSSHGVHPQGSVGSAETKRQTEEMAAQCRKLAEENAGLRRHESDLSHKLDSILVQQHQHPDIPAQNKNMQELSVAELQDISVGPSAATTAKEWKARNMQLFSELEKANAKTQELQVALDKQREAQRDLDHGQVRERERLKELERELDKAKAQTVPTTAATKGKETDLAAQVLKIESDVRKYYEDENRKEIAQLTQRIEDLTINVKYIKN